MYQYIIKKKKYNQVNNNKLYKQTNLKLLSFHFIYINNSISQ